MVSCQQKADGQVSQVWITPTSASRAPADEPQRAPPRYGQASVLLVDEPHPFRTRTAAKLATANLDVIQASDVYEALRLARGREIDLLVIGGDQQYQSGWRCAAKLCGHPPWRGAILYFAHTSDRDRLWGRVSQVAALVETGGDPETLVREVLRGLDQSRSAIAHRCGDTPGGSRI